ncbi:MAG: hypothetical protein CVU59_11920, partial [Deltaproteobacteria bacterium HGW-Deltaproteobacteria-17]
WTGTTFRVHHPENTTSEVGSRFDGYVWTADLSPDGRTLAVGSWDHTVQLIDPRADVRRPARVLRLDGPVTYVRFSSDGRRLFAATFKMLHVVDTTDWKTLDRHIIGVVSGNGPPVSLSRRTIAFHETEEEISLFELATAKLSAIKPEVKNMIEGATRMIEPGVLVVQDDAFCLHLIHPPVKKPRHTLCGLGSSLATAALNATGDLLLAAGDDHTVRLWSVPEGRLLLVLPTVVGQVASFDFGQKNILFERGNQLWRIPVDATLWRLPATELMKSAEALSGLCLEGSRLRPLHECHKLQPPSSPLSPATVHKPRSASAPPR